MDTKLNNMMEHINKRFDRTTDQFEKKLENTNLQLDKITKSIDSLFIR